LKSLERSQSVHHYCHAGFTKTVVVL
jgi:hypothetical protein